MAAGWAAALLIGVLAFAVAKPARAPEALVAVPAALVAVGTGLVPLDAAREQVVALGPTVGFLAAVLVLAHVAERRGGVHLRRCTRRAEAPEREVLAVAEGAHVLVRSRDGDHRRLGPHTGEPATRFVLDHAPCRVLLVWPDEPPDLATLPPPHHHHHPPPHHPPRRTIGRSGGSRWGSIARPEG